MPHEIGDIFKATSLSVSQHLGDGGQGCNIPPYQRDYSWNKDNIKRLFEDVSHGIRRLTSIDTPTTFIDNSAGYSFLGTIIAIHDSRYETVNPLERTEVPNKVLTVIDGQQRLSTVIIVNIALHSEITKVLHQVRKQHKDAPPHVKWAETEAEALLEELQETYRYDRLRGEKPYRYYPRIIRAYHDVWSSKPPARYTSPIAHFTWAYIDHVHQTAQKGQNTAFTFTPRPTPQSRMILERFGWIQNMIRKIDQFVPSISQLVTSNIDGLWGGTLEPSVQENLQQTKDHEHSKHFRHLVRLMAFAYYLNRHTAITVVTTTTEDDAFDIFEALNSTGEPLTAFETLKPKVIEAETLKDYESSESYRHIKDVEDYLRLFDTGEKKHSETAKMLIPFALSETGTKLETRLARQRAYLRKHYDNALQDSMEDARSVTRSLAQLATFMTHVWRPQASDRPDLASLEIDREEVIFALAALRDLDHTIAISPMFRFYAQCVDMNEPSIGTDRTKNLEAVILATAAFSMLWRSALGGTARIEECYRNIMSGKAYVGEAMARVPRTQGDSSGITAEEYRSVLRSLMHDKGIDQKAEWTRKASAVEHGKPGASRKIARFLLFCASHDSILDAECPGLTMAGQPDTNPMLRWDQWKNDKYFSLEHIAPQEPSGGWLEEVYARESTKHTLGNLVLLPTDANALVSNRSWKHKRLMYSLLSADSKNDFDRLKDELKKEGVEWGEGAERVVNSAKYLRMCKSIAQVSGDWTLDLIERRTERLAGLAWDRLAPWLGLEETDE